MFTWNKSWIIFGFKNISLKSGVGFNVVVAGWSADFRVLRKIS